MAALEGFEMGEVPSRSAGVVEMKRELLVERAERGVSGARCSGAEAGWNSRDSRARESASQAEHCTVVELERIWREGEK